MVQQYQVREKKKRKKRKKEICSAPQEWSQDM